MYTCGMSVAHLKRARRPRNDDDDVDCLYRICIFSGLALCAVCDELDINNETARCCVRVLARENRRTKPLVNSG